MAVDWTTFANLATAIGTLVLALATFASVKSANAAARAAERALATGLRPLLVPSRRSDEPARVHFGDNSVLNVQGGHGGVEVGDDAVLLALALRNVGSGLAVLHGWHFYNYVRYDEGESPNPEAMRMLSRDLYVPAGDTGYWQGAFRDPTAVEFTDALAVIERRESFTIDVLYGDQEGLQRMISRFLFVAEPDGLWSAEATRHWDVERGRFR